MQLTLLLDELPLKGFFLAVLDGRGLFKVLPLLPLANNAFFFDHALEALNGLFKALGFIDSDECYGNHPPSG